MFSIGKNESERLIWLSQCAPARSSHWVIGIDQRDPIDQICNWAATQFQWPCFWHYFTDWVKDFWFETCNSLAVEGAFCTLLIYHEKPWICVKYTTALDRWVRTVAMIWQSRMRSETASIPNGNKWMALCHSLWALLRRKVILRWPSLNQYLTIWCHNQQS